MLFLSSCLAISLRLAGLTVSAHSYKDDDLVLLPECYPEGMSGHVYRKVRMYATGWYSFFVELDRVIRGLLACHPRQRLTSDVALRRLEALMALHPSEVLVGSQFEAESHVEAILHRFRVDVDVEAQVDVQVGLCGLATVIGFVLTEEGAQNVILTDIGVALRRA
jgi:hypothetical protein